MASHWKVCYKNVVSDINECESAPCSNGGTCMDLVDGYHCICALGYNYTHCQNGKVHVYSKIA